jgi:hypothetical protein
VTRFRNADQGDLTPAEFRDAAPEIATDDVDPTIGYPIDSFWLAFVLCGLALSGLALLGAVGFALSRF